MRKIAFFALTVAMAAVVITNGAFADVDMVYIDRKGRAVQVDGFLLEWDAYSARPWVGSSWVWDAVITADGIAGYLSHPKPIDGIDSSGSHTNINADAAPKCQPWTFTFSAGNTKKSFEMTIPGKSAGDFFAFDNGTFEGGGALTVEWLVPWSFFEDDGGEDGGADTYVLTLAAACDTVAITPMGIYVASPRAPRAPASLEAQIAMIALTAALTVALIVARRKKVRGFGRK